MDLLRLKAKMLLKSGEPDRAREVFETVMKEREFPWAKTGLAKLRMYNEELQTAKTMLNEVLDNNPNYLEAYDALAECLMKLDEADEAKTVLAAATKLSPNSVLRQRNLGEVALKLGDLPTAEKAFRRSVAVGEFSILKTPDAYFGLARVCGQKGETKEALRLLTTVQQAFVNDDVRLRAKITEGLVYHESGDYVKARRSGEELSLMLDEHSTRPDLAGCIDMARLLFSVGVKEGGAELIRDIVKNNFDKPLVMAECQEIFDKGRMSDDGADIIAEAKQEATEMMNKGLMLWKGGDMEGAVEWMRSCRNKLPTNTRFLLNYARLLIAYITANGPDTEFAEEARGVLHQVDKISPNHRRYAEMMEQLAQMAVPPPAAEEVEAEPEVDPRQIEQ
jgi:tetratricopeptide (TPR) repeat protein